LLLSMLLLAELSGIGSGPIYLFAVAPTLLVAMILTIAYDARFAVGIAYVMECSAGQSSPASIVPVLIVCVCELCSQPALSVNHPRRSPPPEDEAA